MGKRSIMQTVWWGRERHRQGPRRTARLGGSHGKGFIAGLNMIWATPSGRGLYGKARKRTVKSRKRS